jgi:hypothetical protein
MSISARISAFEKVDDGLKLHLKSLDRDPPGQPFLVILDPTFTPCLDDVIWGGSESVEIQSGGKCYPYRRIMYTRIKEDWI